LIKNLQVSSKNKEINKPAVHKLIGGLKKELGINISSLSINFISEAEITDVNKEYLNHNYATDIITFDYGERKENLDAEILISIDDSKRNAKRYNVKFEEEITRLIIHGILHLLNYTDFREKEKKIMKQRENELLKKFKFILLRSR
jgi:rRNA maturation RNase YbeY